MTKKQITVKDMAEKLKSVHRSAIEQVERFEAQNRDSGAAFMGLLAKLKADHWRMLEEIERFERQNRDSGAALNELLASLKAEGQGALEEIEAIDLNSTLGVARPDKDRGH